MPPIGTFEPRSSATISHEMRELRLTDRSLTLEPPPPRDSHESPPGTATLIRPMPHVRSRPSCVSARNANSLHRSTLRLESP